MNHVSRVPRVCTHVHIRVVSFKGIDRIRSARIVKQSHDIDKIVRSKRNAESFDFKKLSQRERSRQ